MKKQKKNIIILIGILILLLLILKNSFLVKENIIKAVHLWLTQVFPSLFPMFVLSDLMIRYQLPDYLSNLFGKGFTKVFHTSSYGFFIFIVSLISGTPSSAFLIKDLLKDNKITEKEASFLLSFTFFSNPLFLMNMLSLLFKNNLHIVLKLILIHYGVNLTIGFLLRPKEKKEYQKQMILPNKNNLGTSLSSAMKKALDTLLIILGTISFYYMIANLFMTKNPLLNSILSGLFELTQGLNSLQYLQITEKLKEILAISFISFGGISIHTQIKSILSDTNVSYYPFLKGRILHVWISILFVILI